MKTNPYFFEILFNKMRKCKVKSKVLMGIFFNLLGELFANCFPQRTNWCPFHGIRQFLGAMALELTGAEWNRGLFSWNKRIIKIKNKYFFIQNENKPIDGWKHFGSNGAFSFVPGLGVNQTTAANFCANLSTMSVEICAK